MTKFGPMDIDFRVRCVKPNGNFDRIYYGNTVEDYKTDGSSGPTVYDLTDTYKELSRGGRQSGNAIENDWKLRKHYFNKRIQTDEERTAGHVRSVGSGNNIDTSDTSGSNQSIE